MFLSIRGNTSSSIYTIYVLNTWNTWWSTSCLWTTCWIILCAIIPTTFKICFINISFNWGDFFLIVIFDFFWLLCCIVTSRLCVIGWRNVAMNFNMSDLSVLFWFTLLSTHLILNLSYLIDNSCILWQSWVLFISCTVLSLIPNWIVIWATARISSRVWTSSILVWPF